MGLFDFLKKKELSEITRLNQELERNKANCNGEIEKLNQQLLRFKAITDIEREIDSKNQELNRILQSKTAEINKQEADIKTLNSDYQIALDTYKRLRKEVSTL